MNHAYKTIYIRIWHIAFASVAIVELQRWQIISQAIRYGHWASELRALITLLVYAGIVSVLTWVLFRITRKNEPAIRITVRKREPS